MSLESLRLLGETISLEAVSGEAAELTALARLPAFLKSARHLYQSQLSKSISAILEFTAQFTSELPRLKRQDYSRIRTMQVQVPEGLKVDMLTYMKVLSDCAQNLKLIEAQMITPFYTWLNFLLSNPASLSSISSTLQIVEYRPLDIEGMRKAIDACFVTKGRLESMVPYGQVFKRQADWEQVDANRVNITRALTPALHKAVTKSMGELEITLDTLLVRLTKNADKYKPGPTVIREIAKVAYAVAEAIEFYGLLRYNVEAAEHSLDEISKAILS